MLSLIRVITAAAIQVHAALGCCGHHWRHADEHSHVHHEPSGRQHACRDVDVAAALAVNDCDGCLCASHEHAPHACRHANCNWSATDVRNLGSLSLQKLEHAGVHRLGASLTAIDLPSTSAFAALEPPLHHAPPVRTHLANCVLLI